MGILFIRLSSFSLNTYGIGDFVSWITQPVRFHGPYDIVLFPPASVPIKVRQDCLQDAKVPVIPAIDIPSTWHSIQEVPLLAMLPPNGFLKCDYL